uniref:Uncharacterized protein n=1 Tax=Arundo donax TaxID=35708 RepID=A0A0A9AQZ4_ARUDO
MIKCVCVRERRERGTERM